jgi:uncharacterized membrane protein
VQEMGARDILPGLQFAGEEEMRLFNRKLVSAAVGVCLFTLIVLAQSPVAVVSQAERDMSIKKRSPKWISLVLAGRDPGTTQRD